MSIQITITKGEDSKSITIADEKISDFETGFNKQLANQENETIIDTLKKLIKDTIYAYYASGKEKIDAESLESTTDNSVLG